MKTAKKVLHVFMVIVVCCFITFALAKLVKGVFMKQPLTHTFGYATVTIKEKAGSMYPTLSPGDTLLVKKQKSYAEGDIIAFAEGNILVTHRIVEVTSEGYVTKGDNPDNSIDANVVKIDDVQGKMIKVLGGFEKFCLSIWGFLTLVLIVFALDTGFGMIVNKKLGKPITGDADDNYEVNVEKFSDEEENIEQDHDDEEADAYEAVVDGRNNEDK